MFVRVLELALKVEKKPDLIKRAKNDIVPILHKQRGFVDILALEGSVELNRALIVTFWHTALDAERYEKEMFATIKQILEPFLLVPPAIKMFTVEETISEKFTQAMAA
jgi:heme-degrading monooxygenase HmoA